MTITKKKLRSDVHEVHLCRVHKSSPYNVSAVIPEIINEDRNEVINMPEVQNLIKKTYGKMFYLFVFTEESGGYHIRYEIEKTKAILPVAA